MVKYINELDFPFNGNHLMRKRKSIKQQLLLNSSKLIEKRIAILGGSTTHDIKDMLELFLLNYGISPLFYESEYAQFWQDAMFENALLERFKPDIVFIHTSFRNISSLPEITDNEKTINEKLDNEYQRFSNMWLELERKYQCIIIQNNFEYPLYRLLGNKDASDIHGWTNFVTKLNLMFSEFAAGHDGFYINDINYQAADFGLQKWSDPFFWHMYKYSLSLEAIPTLAFNVANIIKSIYGKNKKAIALDLDNTLWGGIVGDDGPEKLEIGQETSMGQAYSEFQDYLLLLKKQGVLLNIISKNEPENAKAGLAHPQMKIKTDDLISIKTNWEPKSNNLIQMAQELNLLPESFVFADDNPAEREIIKQQVNGVGIPELDKVEHYITAIDRAGYFETTTFSKDDLKRVQMYKENIQRNELMNSFADYHDYLLSLQMKADVKAFESLYFARIAQLTNKSNQFNLTTKRYTQEEIEKAASDKNTITLYGKLEDRFGDNGIVAITIAERNGDEADIILWLMSCRVLKRNMEHAMMDELVKKSLNSGIKRINGYYYPTAKNAMVKNFYSDMGFFKIEETGNGNTKWVLDISNGYQNKNDVIEINRGE